MATLHLLGTGAAFSDADRTTTMLAFSDDDATVVVDCGGDVVQRLLAHGIDLAGISALVVTHEHADHVAGFPLMMERLWLAGRRRPLDVYGIPSAIRQVRRIHDAFDTSDWPDYPSVRYHEVPLEEGAAVFEDERWTVTSSPGTHSVPVAGLRVVDRRGGGVLAYSCDTEESDAIRRLAHGADLLVHEATGEHPGHSSATVAGAVAADAGVDRLVLVHIAPGARPEELVAEAGARFRATEVGHDGARYQF